jgi:hypothetical protein
MSQAIELSTINISSAGKNGYEIRYIITENDLKYSRFMHVKSLEPPSLKVARKIALDQVKVSSYEFDDEFM